MSGLRFLVGTYAAEKASGIYEVRYDPAANRGEVTHVSHQKRPSWLEKRENTIFAVSEMPLAGEEQGAVCTYSLKEDGIQLVKETKDLPKLLPHLALSQEKNRLYTASYGEGLVLLMKLQEDGSLEVLDTAVQKGSSVHPIRQTCPHPHSVWETPEGGCLCMCDLGTDEIVVYRVEDKKLLPWDKVSVPAGYGVRHMVFSPDGKKAYAITELKYRILVLSYDGNGHFRIEEDLPVCENLPEGEHSGGAIRLCGDMLYCTNRGAAESRIDWLRTDEMGVPKPVGHIHTGCACPRDIALTPDMQYLLCANQKGDSVSIYGRSPETGGLTYLTSIPDIPTPCCILPI